jgi:hypothetical protein
MRVRLTASPQLRENQARQATSAIEPCAAAPAVWLRPTASAIQPSGDIYL